MSLSSGHRGYLDGRRSKIIQHRRTHDKTPQNTKAPSDFSLGALWGNNPGDVLLSHMASHAVPSAPTSLTSEFGMGSGVALSISPPEILGQCCMYMALALRKSRVVCVYLTTLARNAL